MPYTQGFLPPNRSLGDEPVQTNIAGLQVAFSAAPSDCDDSITIWFPQLSVCINNLVWPTLFNVFPIRGEEYRDPRGLIKGLEHIASLNSEYLVGAHGIPITGRDVVAGTVNLYRDSIQFMWDQTVRGINRGLTCGELTEFVKLPATYSQNPLTRQNYGVLEHHVRQIHAGLRGWFDGNEGNLFPLPESERAERLIKGFGGEQVVRARVREAIDGNDLRWAIEMASWLIRREKNQFGRADGGSPEDRRLLAETLRLIAQRTTATNIRYWCLTRARELDGLLELSRFRRHRFQYHDVLAQNPAEFVHCLRVLLVPERCNGVDELMRWEFSDGTRVGLRIRHHVAIPVDAAAAPMAVRLELTTWATLLANKATLFDAISDGRVQLTGSPGDVLRWFGRFDHAAFDPTPGNRAASRSNSVPDHNAAPDYNAA